MRIIAGEFRGRTILSPETDDTRPITDRAKQSLFDVLAPLIPDAIVCDCFAGTGSMGLEALSRGASRAIFMEKDRTALKLLRQNIDALGVADRSTVLSGDVFKSIEQLPDGIGLFFLDPPYRFVREQVDALRQLAQVVQSKLAPEATLIFRHDPGDSLELAGFRRYDQRDYGRMRIELLRPER